MDATTTPTTSRPSPRSSAAPLTRLTAALLAMLTLAGAFVLAGAGTASAATAEEVHRDASGYAWSVANLAPRYKKISGCNVTQTDPFWYQMSNGRPGIRAKLVIQCNATRKVRIRYVSLWGQNNRGDRGQFAYNSDVGPMSTYITVKVKAGQQRHVSVNIDPAPGGCFEDPFAFAYLAGRSVLRVSKNSAGTSWTTWQTLTSKTPGYFAVDSCGNRLN